MRPPYPQRTAAVITVVAIVGLVNAYHVQLAADSESIDTLIQRVVAQTTRSGVGIRAIRELQAGTVSGKHEGWMQVETVLTSSGTFTWRVIEERGSSRTRARVFRGILEAEAESWRAGSRDASALTPANYEFQPLPVVAGQRQIRLKPRRADSHLIDGTLTVSSEGCPLMLEGTLAKSPSFWVKSIRVTKRYGQFAGVALPTTVESVAEIKMFGQSRFSMRYSYSEVNGQQLISNPIKSLGDGQ